MDEEKIHKLFLYWLEVSKQAVKKGNDIDAYDIGEFKELMETLTFEERLLFRKIMGQMIFILDLDDEEEAK